MSDEELMKHCMCGCIYLEAECPNCNKVTDADRIDELEVSLQAVLDREAATTARYDAKTDELEDKLAKVVEAADRMLDAFCVHETQQQVEAYDSMCATLAEIKGEKP
jgi:hypothetical protein